MRRYTIANKKDQLPYIPAPGPGSYDVDTYVQKLNITTGFVSDRSHYVSYSYGHIRRVPQQYYANHIPRFPSINPNQTQNLGPGQYDVISLKKPRALSLSQKRSNPYQYSTANNIKKTPTFRNIGPGCYDINYSQVQKKSAVISFICPARKIFKLIIACKHSYFPTSNI